jgi:hypothetical protein
MIPKTWQETKTKANTAKENIGDSSEGFGCRLGRRLEGHSSLQVDFIIKRKRMALGKLFLDPRGPALICYFLSCQTKRIQHAVSADYDIILRQ